MVWAIVPSASCESDAAASAVRWVEASLREVVLEASQAGFQRSDPTPGVLVPVDQEETFLAALRAQD